MVDLSPSAHNLASRRQELVISVCRNTWTKYTASSNARTCQPPVTLVVKLRHIMHGSKPRALQSKLLVVSCIPLLVALQNIRESGGPQNCQQTGLRPFSETIISLPIFDWPDQSIESLFTLETLELNHSLCYDNTYAPFPLISR